VVGSASTAGADGDAKIGHEHRIGHVEFAQERFDRGAALGRPSMETPTMDSPL
jgi:hypothetical protein